MTTHASPPKVSASNRSGLSRIQAASTSTLSPARVGDAPVQLQATVGDLDFDFGLPSDSEGIEAELDTSASAQQTSTAKLSTKKKEALSQVPCKFFRSNGCSAGNSCPFAHINPGESSSKAVCQWFLKGNCRFGHKCALAHVLPGQPLSMDRKNKRAHQNQGHGHQNPALYQQHQQRPSQQFSVPGNTNAQQYTDQYRTNGYGAELVMEHVYPVAEASFGTQEGLYAGTDSTAQRQQDWSTRLRNERESQPRGMQAQPDQHAIIAPSTSTPTQIFGTSPFSHPGSQSVFYSEHSSDLSRPGHAIRAPLSFSGSLRNVDGSTFPIAEDTFNHAELDDDVDNAEEFLPSSLSDLLTPAELDRRRKSVLSMQRAAQPSKLASQSVPGSGTELNGADGPATMHAQRPSFGALNSDVHLRAAWNKSADGGSKVTQAQWGSSPRFGASNTSTGFLASRLREELNIDDEIPTHDFGHIGSSQPFGNDTNVALKHVPGQSLPQGLAAGLSRLHLRSSHEPNVAASRVNDSLLSSSRDRLSSAVDDPQQSQLAVYGAIGADSKPDELGPTVPSSIFAAQRNTPLHQRVAHKNGQLSTSVPFGSPASSGNVGVAALTNDKFASSLSNGRHDPLQNSFAESPSLSAQSGIAIPHGNVGSIGDSVNATANSTQQRSTYGSAAMQQHKVPAGSVHRMRHSGHQNHGLGSNLSPFALPTTGEEVEEAIFELE